MDWHIVTSSKGGVGKTLISLMLTAYHCTHNHTLVVDLNGMNADLSRLLSPEGKSFREETDYLFLELSLGQTKSTGVRPFHFEKVGGKSELRVGYINAWPKDPFQTFDAQTFTNLLVELKKKIDKELYNRFGYSIQTVIIDTNSHFCSLFSDQSKDYEVNLFKEDNFFIWFIWVYRQFADLMEEARVAIHNIAPRTVKERALLIENKLKNDRWGNPFVHIFSPVFIGEMNQNFLKKVLNLKKDGVFLIPPLEELFKKVADERKMINNAIEFNTLLQRLKGARTEVRRTANFEDNELFIKMLETYVRSLTACPRNLVPLHIYEKSLLGYTEANYQGLLLDQIYGGLKVYRDSFEIAYHALTKRS